MQEVDLRELQAEIDRLKARLTEVGSPPAARLRGLIARVGSSPRVRIGLVAAVLGMAAVSYAATVSVPYTFVNGTVADADEVNANFSALETAVNDVSFRLTCQTSTQTTTEVGPFTMLCPSGYIATGSGWEPASNWDSSASHMVQAGTDSQRCQFYIGGLAVDWLTSCTCCRVIAD